MKDKVKEARKRQKILTLPPLVVCLKDSHYFTLEHPEGQKSWPMTWAEKPVKTMEPKFVRGAGRSMAEEAEDVPEPDLASWCRPPSSTTSSEAPAGAS